MIGNGYWCRPALLRSRSLSATGGISLREAMLALGWRKGTFVPFMSRSAAARLPAASVLIALLATISAVSANPPAHASGAVEVFVGYADTPRPVPDPLPTPFRPRPAS